MKVLVLGTGAREHALAWKIKQSPEVDKVYVHPGNGGTESNGFPTLEIPQMTPESVTAEAKRLGVNLVVVGPEVLLAQGYSDALRAAPIMVVGPSQSDARLETSKFYAKQFMVRANVPTARFVPVNTKEELLSLNLETFPLVLKLDGLAAGKGVVIAQSRTDIKDFADRVYGQEEFGPGPHIILVEDFIRGRELSYIGFCDGTTFVPLASATDYKRIGDNHTGLNTGGMGCISPSPYLTPSLQKNIDEQVIEPILKEMQKEKMQYRGILYSGLMVTETEVPNVLEFNTRFGDPETQCTLLRLESDILPLLVATARGELAKVKPPVWSPNQSLYVVAAAKGYPSTPKIGDRITFSGDSECEIFFAGVKKSGRDLLTSGGRVLGVGTTGKTLDIVRERAYKALSKISWDGVYFRRDIGL